MENFDEKLEAFAALLEQQQRQRYRNQFGTEHPELENAACSTSIKPGKKYSKIDIGTSGKYMVVNETGEIFGIKAYGVIHRGHPYGTLDTTAKFWWGDYSAMGET